MTTYDPQVLVDDFVFLEGPRWRDGKLWISDMWDHKVRQVDPNGGVSDVIEIPNRPSGLGFLPDGSVLIVSMADRIVYRYDGAALNVYADLSGSVRADINDMVVDDQGRAYVGNFGYDLLNDAPAENAEIILIETDGSHRIVADDLMFPNGMVITNGGGTLVVAETFGNRLTAYDRDSGGNLSARRVHADLGEMTPDGICADVDGGIWVASFMTGDFIRVGSDGRISDQFNVGRAAVACQLGGADNRTLFCLTFGGEIADIASGARLARIETVTVDVAGASSP